MVETQKRLTVLSAASLNGESSKVREAEPWQGRGALIFPGQGAWKPGIGKDFFENSHAARVVFAAAEEEIPGITTICFKDPNGDLRRTDMGQLASGVVDVAAAAALNEKYPQLTDMPPVASAGISFGELPSLVVAGVIEFKNYLRFVKERGNIMQEVGEKNPGRMVMAYGLSEEVVRGICEEIGVYPAIYYPGVTVISGLNANINRAMAAIEAQKGKARETGVLFPFHTPIMGKARDEIAEYMKDIPFADAAYPIVLSANGFVTKSGEELKEGILDQITGAAYLPDTIEQMKKLGASLFVELCPQPVLTAHLKKGNKEVTAVAVHDLQSLQDLQLSFEAA